MRTEREALEQEEDDGPTDTSHADAVNQPSEVHTGYMEVVTERGTWGQWTTVAEEVPPSPGMIYATSMDTDSGSSQQGTQGFPVGTDAKVLATG